MCNRSHRAQKKDLRKTTPKNTSVPGVAPAATIQASAETAAVFSVLLDKRLARRGLSWDRFEAAMRALDFRITRKKGARSFYEPPASIGRKGLMVRKPEGGRWDAGEVTHLGKRLTKLYGWDEKTF